MTIYPKNTASHFNVNMREPLELSDQWEVALSELQYPCAWDNIRKGSNTFLIRFCIRGISPQKAYIIPKQVPAGYYADTSSLVATMNSLMENHAVGKLKGIRLQYDEVARRVTIITKNVVFTDPTEK